MRAFGKIIGYMLVPILFMNLFSAIIGGVWLVLTGDWRLVLAGVVYGVASVWVLSLLMMPAMMLAPLAISLKQRRNIACYLIVFICDFYTNLLILVSCSIAFVICVKFYDGSSMIALVPYLLWSWGMSLGPWQSMSVKDGSNEFEGITMFVACTCYLLFLGSIFVGGSMPSVVIVFSILTLLIGLPLFNIWVANKISMVGRASCPA